MTTTPTSIVTGEAGSGKTHSQRERIKLDPTYGKLCATTGVAAQTLGDAQTIHSLMSYSDLDDLRRTVRNGGFFNRLRKLVLEGELWPGCKVVIDEVSMLNAEQLDRTFEAFEQLNNWVTNGGVAAPQHEGQIKHENILARAPIGLVLVGDFAQLPPVEGDFAFKAQCWPMFEENRVHLTTQYRQAGGAFLSALNAARKGDGQRCIQLLGETAAKYTYIQDPNFDGLTIFGTNAEVRRFNDFRYSQLKGDEFISRPVRRGEQKADWKKEDIIPNELRLKVGARVMILANEPETFRYCNGDMGEVVKIHAIDDQVLSYTVKLDRLVKGAKLVRGFKCEKCGVTITERKLIPTEYEVNPGGDVVNVDEVIIAGEHINCKGIARFTEMVIDSDLCNVIVGRVTRELIDPDYHGPKWKARELGKIRGEVSYFPIKLGYALTIHKCQGLTVDKIQFNISHPFVGQPAMSYVALSRVRTPEGLTIIGSPDMLAQRIAASPEVMRWL